jgi:lipopolysaccharide export system permease protein
MFSLVFILNLLSELEFFKDIEVSVNFTLLLSLLNSPSMIFEMFPFIFLLTTQFFFIKLFNNNELEVFKYSGLKNSNILWILGLLSFLVSIIIIIVFYNFSANFKNFYLEKKSQYTSDGKYLAVITKNGLWIKDEIDDKIYIINSSEIKDYFLINNFITEFNDNYEVIRNLQSKKIDIKEKIWSIYNAKIYNNNDYEIKELLEIKTNFDYKRIKTLYSNL